MKNEKTSPEKSASLKRPLAERVTVPRVTKKTGAKQIFAPETDINNIMKRHIASNTPLPAPTSKPQYLDLTKLPSNLMDAHALKSRLNSVLSNLPQSLLQKIALSPPAQTEPLIRQYYESLRTGKGGQGAAERSQPPVPTPSATPNPGASAPNVPSGAN